MVDYSGKADFITLLSDFKSRKQFAHIVVLCCYVVVLCCVVFTLPVFGIS